jgi:hypothetical protein
MADGLLEAFITGFIASALLPLIPVLSIAAPALCTTDEEMVSSCPLKRIAEVCRCVRLFGG